MCISFTIRSSNVVTRQKNGGLSALPTGSESSLTLSLSKYPYMQSACPLACPFEYQPVVDMITAIKAILINFLRI